MRLQSRKKSTRATVAAEGSRRVEAALLEQQRLLGAVASRASAADARDVHDARVAARRLRSQLKTFRPLLDERRSRLMRADLRSFARALAAVREADVRRDLLLSLVRGDDAMAPSALERLNVRLDDLCLEARATMRRHLGEPGWTALCRAIEDPTAIPMLVARRDAGLEEFLGLVDDSWCGATSLLRRELQESDELHQLRLALKHCRYALEPAADVQPKAATRLLRRLRSAQDSLGEHRDTLLAEHWVRSNERSLGRSLSGQLLERLERHERRLRRRAAERATRVLAAYQEWRRATRSLRKGKTTVPG